MQERPVGVTVLSILQFLGAACSLLAALAFFLGGGAVAAALAGSGREGGALGGGIAAIIMGVGGIFFLVMSALWLATAIGMWKLKGWGRWLTIIFTGIAALFAVLGLLLTLIHFSPILFVVRIIFLAIYALILWYMFTPEVQRAFQSK
jgi:hypothetical protein